MFMRFFCLFLGAIFLTFKVYAEEADSLNSRSVGLEEVVIQSFKQADKIRTLPISASMISKLNLQNQNVLGIKDISSFIPNLFMPDYGSKLASSVYIRGIGSRINSPSVGLYVDGVPYFDKAALDFDLNEIDYIEILRGPQGTLYGRNTMGGLINVYTKSPLRHQGTFVSITGGTYSLLNANVGYYGKVNDNFGYSISGTFNHTDGYFTNQFTGKKADELNSGSGRLRLEWKIKPDMLLRFTQNVDHSNQGGYPYAPIDSTNKISEVNYNEPSYYKRTLSSSGLSFTYWAEKFSLNSQTSYQYLSDDYGIDNDFTVRPNIYVNQKQKHSTFSEDLNIKSTLSSRYQWLFGIFAFNQHIDNDITTIRPAYSTQKLYDMPTRGISFYHQSTLKDLFVDGLSLTVGLRYDYEKASDDYHSFMDSIGVRRALNDDFSSNLSFSQLTPKFTLQYTLPSSQMIYTSITRGYKTGGFNNSFMTFEDRTFNPEYSWNYEIGAKGGFWDNRLVAEMSFFFIDWKNQQIYQALSIGGQMLKNAGHSQSKGIELSLLGKICEGLTLQVNGGITNAKFLEYVQSATVDHSGNYIPSVPAQTLGLAATYLMPLKSKLIENITYNLQYTGTGNLYWSEDNKIKQPYYGLLNGKVSASKGITTVSLWAKNITNTEYTAYSFTASSIKYAQKGRPFTAGISVNLQIK